VRTQLCFQFVKEGLVAFRSPKAFHIFKKKKVWGMLTDQFHIGSGKLTMLAVPTFIFSTNRKIGARRPTNKSNELRSRFCLSYKVPQLIAE
jgi:hypothetical protein